MRGNIHFMFLMLLWRQVRSIHIEELRVPGHVAAGGEALLGCYFNLGADLLYSVKWYKDGREFYRYMPRSANQTLRFVRPGVTVDMSRSSSDVVTLVDLKPESAGLYKCEVSGEKPLFATTDKEKYFTVHVLPKGGPRITGLRVSRPYDIGDRLIANCTTSGSRPEARLKWLINNKTVGRGYLRGPWYRVVQNPPDTTETTLGLNIMVLPSHFRKDVMEVKCQATIAPLYQREKVYVLPSPEEPTEKPEELDYDDKSLGPFYTDIIQDNVINRFGELANQFDLHLSTSTEKPKASDKAFSSFMGRSLGIILLTMLVQVILS